MKKSLLYFVVFCLFAGPVFSQKEEIEKNFKEKEAKDDFTYLASDELMGRDPIRPEIEKAYTYIAEQLEKSGTMPVTGGNGYYQDIPFRISSPPAKGIIIVGDSTYSQGQNLLVLDGNSISGNYELIDVGFGLVADFEGKNLNGKIAVSNVGAPDRISPSDLFALGREKSARAKAAGAIALIERFNIPSVPWQLISNFLNKTQLGIDEGENSELPYIWIKDLKNHISTNTRASLEIEGKSNTHVTGKNVIAWIEGTDPKLKKEFIMLSAHYDHVGVGRPDVNGDSIYNGARDNAVGTVAVLNAARYFSKNPPKRSVVLALWTAEEKGLLGSRYFAENPLIPLKSIVYNLNIDNGGYNDTSVITVIGLGRTTADDHLAKASEEFGLKAISDPSPEQGLYDRSDNVNFARKGIPAPTFSLGFRAFDDEINKYYHKPGDHVENFDLNYAMLYWKSYILSAELIANDPKKPLWIAGDKYEEAGKALYGDR